MYERTPIKRLGGSRPGRNAPSMVRLPKRHDGHIDELAATSEKAPAEVTHVLLIIGLAIQTDERERRDEP